MQTTQTTGQNKHGYKEGLLNNNLSSENETQGPRPDKIRQMFSEISENYDLANTVLSAGVHHLWRKAVVRWSDAKPGNRVLDCATGTGDLAIEFKRVVGSEGSVLGTDFCVDMMLSGPAKAEKNGMQISFEQADVMNLPYAAASFDISSIAFGIRNVPDPARALCELARVTRPGGVVMILEFGQPKHQMLGTAYNWYSRKVLPKIGGWITGRPEAYEYLQNSSAHFPCREEFIQLMRKTDRFESAEYRSLSLGIAYIYKAVVR